MSVPTCINKGMRVWRGCGGRRLHVVEASSHVEQPLVVGVVVPPSRCFSVHVPLGVSVALCQFRDLRCFLVRQGASLWLCLTLRLVLCIFVCIFP